MAYIDWWNRTGPITMGERFGLNEISTRAKTLSPIKSHTASPLFSPLPADFDEISLEEMEDLKKQVKFGQQVKDGGRIGLAQGTPLYTATAENFKFLDNLILNTKKTLNEIKSAFGGEPKAGNQGINKLIEAWSASSKDRVVPSERFKTYKLTAESPQVKRVLDLFENKKMSVNAISKKLKIDRKLIRHYFLAADKAEYIGEPNAPTGEGKWNYKKTRAKIIKKLTEELKGMKDGEKILKEMTKKLDSIWAKNDEILKMTDKEILNNKTFKEAMNLDVKGLKIGEGINFNRYVDLTPQEYVAKIRAMAKNKTFFQPEHSIPINAKNVKSLYPQNIYTAVGKMGGQMEVLKNYVNKNPDGKITQEIKALLKNQNLALPKAETSVLQKAGKALTWAGKKLIPIMTPGGSHVLHGGKYDLTSGQDLSTMAFWKHATDWMGARSRWGNKMIGLKKRLRDIALRGGLPTRFLPLISGTASVAAGPMLIKDAAEWLQSNIDKEGLTGKIEEQSGMIGDEAGASLLMEDVRKKQKESVEGMDYAQGGIASLIK